MTEPSTDPLTTLLERRLAGESTSGAVQELIRANPQLGLLAALLERDDHPQTQDRLDERRLSALRQRTESLRRRFNEVLQEADDAMTRLGIVADALGACAVCWGEDLDCGWCHGRGRPGFAVPEPTFFENLVLPAVRTAARMRRASRPNLPDEKQTER